MSHLSFLKLLTPVFFALFILSACGGDDTVTNNPTFSTNYCAAGTEAVNNECVPLFDPAYCAAGTKATNNQCVDPYTPKALADFQTDEYNKSNALGGVKAAYAYRNIDLLIDADNNSGTITQGGAGQIVSVVSNEINVTHQEFTENGTQAAAFDSYYIPNNGYNPVEHTDNADIIGANNCTIGCGGTRYAALIAARKGDTHDQMHGIAYNAQLKAIAAPAHYTNEVLAVPAGVGSDIIAMNYVTIHNFIDSASIGNIRVCYADGGTNRKYNRSAGLNQGKDDCNAANDRTDTRHRDDVLAAWVAAVNPNSVNKTIMVLPTVDDGLNSETGQLQFLTDASNKSIDFTHPANATIERNALTITGSVAAANIPSFRAAYPAFYNDDALEAGRWLAVTAVDENGAILASANGCGVAMNFCLAAPGKNIYAANNNDSDYHSYAGTSYASSTVAGGLAVLKGAFPNATPEELTRLVLETSTYIAMATDETTYRAEVTTMDGGTRYVNPVYGYGVMNLETATRPSTIASYVTASNNESIGALWQDTKLILSSHFGGNFESVTFGIGDAYGRHFITNAPQTSYAPVAVSLDDYIGNLLGENVQSQRLGGQAQANYSNTENQSWMNLEYISGKATTKIAFQDSYKINPLSDTGTTTILRANNIRPASTNIGMMDVDYQLGNALTLSSYVARGEYDTGYKFDELGTDFDVNYKQSHLNIAIGNIREHGQFLGTNTSGAYALNAPSISRFTDVTYGHDLGKFNIYANYINYETDVDMLHDQFATIDGLQADQYQIGFTGRDLLSDDDSLNVALITKLGVTDGALNQNSTLGYTADGAFNNASQSYDLAVSNRHQQFEITYQGKLYQNADKISALRDNRFFTSIIVDSNLNHVQGASQVEVVSGINIRY